MGRGREGGRRKEAIKPERKQIKVRGRGDEGADNRGDRYV